MATKTESSRASKIFNRVKLSLVLIIIPTFLWAQEVSSDDVESTVKTFINSRIPNSSIASIDSIFSQDDYILGYLVNLKPMGFVVTTSNLKLNPIVSYSNSSNCTIAELLSTFIYEDLDYRQKLINTSQLKSSLNRWENFTQQQTLKLALAEEIFGPLLVTNWHQRDFFNKFCPDDPVSSKKSAVGCVATASSQILHYWKFPSAIHFNNSDGYTSKGYNGNISIPEEYSSYNFPSFQSLNERLEVINYDNEDDIASLCFGVGVKLEMSYSSLGSSATTAKDIFLDLGYGSAQQDDWSEETKTNLIENIKKGWPVQVSIKKTDKNTGHSVVFDGYNPSTTEFHVNLGWGRNPETTWYLPSNIEGYDFIRSAVYNVCPNLAWSQFAADAQNTRRTTYEIPKNNEGKWSVNCQNGYHFNGLVIGANSNIIASCSPNSDGNHPYVYFYNKSGDLLDKIELSETTEGLLIPVQSQNGDVYVISKHGKLFHINQTTSQAKIIFEEPYGTEITWGMKIDKGGNLYVSAWDKFYCLNSDGSIKWQKSLPNGKYWVREPAIDDVNGFVLYQYFNGNQEQSGRYIVYDINSGNEIDYKEIYAQFGSKMGAASINSQGKAFFGVHGKLYEYNPNSKSINTIIETNGISKNSPTIGINGNLYISYWKNDNDYVIASIDPVTKTVLWDEKITSYDYDYIREIYTDSKSRICFTYHYEDGLNPDKHEVYVIKDNGSSYNFDWSNSYNIPDGHTFLGPDKTMFLIHSNKIVAISEIKDGETFSDYTDNRKPNIPQLSNPVDNSIDSDEVVTFNWSCSDPDGHPLKYDFYLGSSTDIITLYQSNLSSNNITISGFTPDSTYLWSIVASDGQSHSQSAINKFKTNKQGISLSSIMVSDVSSVYENSSESYTCTANYSDGSTQDVTSSTSWSLNSSYATINSNGVLIANSVNSDQSCIITASYGGKSDTQSIIIKDQSGNSDELIWEDGFENYASGTFPSNWLADANATNLSKNKTDNSTQKEGTNSLKLFGTLGGCWGALAYRSISVSPPYYITFDVKNGTEQLSGCHPDRASIALRKGTSWSNPSRSLVDFKNDGKIYANGGDLLASYSANTWINVIIKYELPASNQVMTTFWINNNLIGEYYSSTIADENGLDNLQLAVQEGTAWFDNVKIYKLLSIPTGFNSYVYENKIRIYPNPVKDQITISIDDQNLINSNVKIINSLGSIVSIQKLDSYETKINTSSLLSGFYIIQIQNCSFIYNEKIAK